MATGGEVEGQSLWLEGMYKYIGTFWYLYARQISYTGVHTRERALFKYVLGPQICICKIIPLPN